MAKKCDRCLRGTRVRTTGVNPSNTTLRLDIGGAVLYVTPRLSGDNRCYSQRPKPTRWRICCVLLGWGTVDYLSQRNREGGIA